MGLITMQFAALLAAPPAEVYATIADYQHGHPRILPQANLYDLRVEQGGYGDGTVIRFRSRLFGVERAFHQQIVELEPGRVLREQSIVDAAHEATTFTVLPAEQGTKSQVTIATILPASPGIQGYFERLILPRALASIYRKELALLESVAQQRALQAQAV